MAVAGHCHQLKIFSCSGWDWQTRGWKSRRSHVGFKPVPGYSLSCTDLGFVPVLRSKHTVENQEIFHDEGSRYEFPSLQCRALLLRKPRTMHRGVWWAIPLFCIESNHFFQRCQARDLAARPIAGWKRPDRGVPIETGELRSLSASDCRPRTTCTRSQPARVELRLRGFGASRERRIPLIHSLHWTPAPLLRHSGITSRTSSVCRFPRSR